MFYKYNKRNVTTINGTFIYGFHAIKSILQNNFYLKNVEKVYILENRKDSRAQEIIFLLNEHKILYEFLDRKELDILVNRCKHQGFVALVQDINLVDYAIKTNDLNFFVETFSEKPFFLILEEIQDPYNLGACLRTAGAAGVNCVMITKNNSCDITSVVNKVSCGVAITLPIFRITNVVDTLQLLKNNNIWVYGADVSAEKSIFDLNLLPPLALVFGSESKGLSKLTKQFCDFLFNIPMQIRVQSLNVSVAVGIATFTIVRNLLKK